MKEKVRIKESLRIVVKDTNTNRIIEDRTIDVHVPIWKKILYRLLGKKAHATVLDWGFEQTARCLGNVSPTYPINDIGANLTGTGVQWIGTTNTRTTIATAGGGAATLKVNNSLQPWTLAGTYSFVLTRNASQATSYHNSIPCTITIASGQEWWAEVEFRFS